MGVREHVDAGTVRKQAEPRLLLPDRRRSRWPPERQKEHLRDFNIPTLWNISIHEVYPGPLPALPAPAAGGVEGPQVDALRAGVVRRRLGALLRADDGRSGIPARRRRPIRLGQLAEALVRLARFVVAIRLHCEDLSVEQGMRFFRDEAFLEEDDGAA